MTAGTATAGSTRATVGSGPAGATTLGGDLAISVRGLRKRYGQLTVLDGLDLEVKAGTLVALLGPNGAGKTTTVEILEGYRRPDAGEVRVLGLDPQRDGAALRPRIGVMLQQGGIMPAAAAARARPAPRPPLRRAGRSRRRARAAGADPRGDSALQAALGRRETAAGPRPGPRRAPGAPAARRADCGHGPGGEGDRPHAHQRPAGGRTDHPPHHARARGRRAPGRPRGRDGPRANPRLRDACRAGGGIDARASIPPCGSGRPGPRCSTP